MNAQHRQQSGPTDRTIGGRIDEERYDEWRSLPAMFFDQAERLGDRPLLISKQGGGWRDRSWGAVAAAIVQAAAGLKSLGVGHGDRVAIVSENRPEWLIADFAIMTLGAITVPAYITSTTADHVHTLRDSGARVVLVSSAALMRKVQPAVLQAPDVPPWLPSTRMRRFPRLPPLRIIPTGRKRCTGAGCWSVAVPVCPSSQHWRRWNVTMSPA